MNKNWLQNIIVILSVMLCGCSFKSGVKTDINSKVQKEFLTKDLSSEGKINNHRWWLEFNDEALNQLIAAALKNNKDIEIANLSIATSRQLNNINITNFFPSGTVGLARQRFSSPGFGPNGISYDLFQSTADATWELDFFGKNLDRYKAGKMRFLSEAQLYKAASLRVASEVAQNYISLKNSRRQIKNLTKISELRNDLVNIAIKKQKIGTVSQEMVYQAQIDYDNASSELIAAKTNEKVLTYKLAVLLGMTPENIIEILADFDKKFNDEKFFEHSQPKVFLGLKSDILQRRPDIVAALYEVEASGFDQSAQLKEFFPSFNLAAKIGGGAKDIGQTIGNGTNVKDIRGTVSLPIFSVGSLIAEYKISKTKTKTAMLNYEKTVLSAIEECESQISRYVNSRQIAQKTYDSWQSRQKISLINRNKKNLGVIANEELILSEIAQKQSDNQMIQSKADSLTNLVALYKALGGGFEDYEIKFSDDKASWIEKSK